jgi:hypothetical protein
MEVKVALGCLKAKAGLDWLEAKTPIRLTPPGRAAFRSESTPGEEFALCWKLRYCEKRIRHGGG